MALSVVACSMEIEGAAYAATRENRSADGIPRGRSPGVNQTF